MHGHAEPTAEKLPRAHQLRVERGRADGGEIGVRHRVRVELPAVGQHSTDHRARQVLVHEVRVLEVEDAGPVVTSEQRLGDRELLAVAVVEREDDRPAWEPGPASPVAIDGVERDRVIPVLRQPAQL